MLVFFSRSVHSDCSLPMSLHACFYASLLVYPPACLHACLPVCLFVRLPACLPACLPTCLPTSLRSSAHPSYVRVFVRPTVRPSAVRPSCGAKRRLANGAKRRPPCS